MVSRAPVCSPTAIICTTIGGKTSVSPRGSLMVLPSSTDLRVAMMASSMMELPAVRAVICRPSRMGTPEEVNVESVRQKPVDDALAFVSLVILPNGVEAGHAEDDDQPPEIADEVRHGDDHSGGQR